MKKCVTILLTGLMGVALYADCGGCGHFYGGPKIGIGALDARVSASSDITDVDIGTVTATDGPINLGGTSFLYGAFLGYQYDFQNCFWLAGEVDVFGDSGRSTSIRSSGTILDSSFEYSESLRTSVHYGGNLLLGYRIWNAQPFVFIGVEGANSRVDVPDEGGGFFEETFSNRFSAARSALRLGFGTQFAVSNCFNLRLDYSYVIGRTVHRNFTNLTDDDIVIDNDHSVQLRQQRVFISGFWTF